MNWRPYVIGAECFAIGALLEFCVMQVRAIARGRR